MTWVKTEWKLQDVKAGEVLEVLVDEGQPVAHLPLSVKEAGHKILKLTRAGHHFVVWIERSGGTAG